MIRRILRWLGFIKPEPGYYFTLELERPVAAIFRLEAFKTEYGSGYTTRRMQSAKSPWRTPFV
jgi:hypothetical protein